MNWHRVKILPGFYIILAVCLVTVPLRWCAAWLAAALVHELSHIAMLKLCRCKIVSITVGVAGAVIESNCDSEIISLLCTVAGPIGGGTLLLISGILPRTAICALIQSVYNLLPFSYLDGGRTLECVVHLLLPRRNAEYVLMLVQAVAVAVLIGLALYGTFWLRLGVMPLLLVGILLLKNKKSLAKNGISEYNGNDKNIRGCSYGYQKSFTHSTKACQVHRW